MLTFVRVVSLYSLNKFHQVMGSRADTAKDLLKPEEKDKSIGSADSNEESISSQESISGGEELDTSQSSNADTSQVLISEESTESQESVVNQNLFADQKKNNEGKPWKIDHETFKLSELNETNWKSWSIKLEAYFELQELWDTVKNNVPAAADQTDEWKKNDKKALNLIKLRVSDKIIGVLSKSTHAHDAYQQLRQHFEGSGGSKIGLLFDRFFQLKVNPPSSIAQFSTEFANIVDEIKALDLKSDEYFGHYYLHLVPEKCQQAATSLRAVGNITFEKARDFLLHEERKQGADSISASVAGMSNQKFRKKLTREEKIKKYPCHTCGELGHFRKDCPKQSKNQESKPSTKSNDGKQRVLGALCVRLNNLNVPTAPTTVYHDNGANDHLFNNKSWFSNLKPASGKIILPNGSEEPICGVGEVHVTQNDQFTLFLKDAKYVPDLHASYICEYNLMLNELEMKPSLKGTTVTTVDGQTVAFASRENGLLTYANLKPIQNCVNSLEVIEKKKENSQSTESNVEMSFRKWHARLGHLNFGDLYRLRKKLKIKGKLKERLKCDTCLRGKAHSRPFRRSKIKSTRVLQLIYSDISGKIRIPNRNHFAYFLTFIDDFSRFTTVYLMKEKSEVYKYFKEFKAQVENKFGTKIATLRSDNGTEYKNHRMEELCKESGIKPVHSKMEWPNE